ncbi:cytochrome P450 4AB12 isoform X1 [Nasonia vitripennis]|uniref:Cytochrome P450 n=1 Tax=Nasonia vitripennis TaxID=7425 RepID=A0A7M7QAK6_NASVI|nr:cytochrome P450 4AB12 precursor [Nasonia vitripennis]XP_031783038.1 cytochrome P450 4AB12 isoform X1 [Nasonia vitripennis]XP_032453606.1 cytochrome P450 4AB12 isoform X1 [Nasonia vitripennis]XP_032453608.1 cytochrome P450 4AB12 isoform X1 [Nasonia vitripennis]XP_032453609.1 cytochrome P450 4AB12 isoform X1 [Nasonia vitripennis]
MFYLLLVILGVLIFHISTRYSRMGKLVNKIPGPRPIPILGNMLLLNVSSDKLFGIMRELINSYYPILKVWFCTNAMVGLRHPDDLEVILSSQKAIDKSYVYGYLEPWLKTGLLTSTGDKWRARRKILTPAFHFQILKKYMDITSEQGEKMIDALRQKKEMVENIVPMCSTFTLNIICESAMGVALDKIDAKELKEYKMAIHDMGDVVVQRSVQPYVLDWMMSPLIKLGRMQKNALTVLHKFTDKVLKERRNYHNRTENKYLHELDDNAHDDDSDKVALGRKKRLAMLDLLLLAEKKGLIDEEGIKEEMDTFTFEGHDTTGIALIFILLMLAENKEAQDKAREEVSEMLNSTGGKISQTEIQDFNYLERCIKETLRLYPSVPNVLRHLTEDLQLKTHTLPAGVDVICFLYDVHRDPNFWPDPEKFDPDRFLPESSAGRHPYAYVPFSAGPRNCIGQKFAMMELKSLVARILYNFQLEPIDRSADVKFTTDLVLRPTNPIRVKFVRIDK